MFPVTDDLFWETCAQPLQTCLQNGFHQPESVSYFHELFHPLIGYVFLAYQPHLSLSRPTFTQIGSKHGRVMYVWGAKGQLSEFLILDWEHTEWRMARGVSNYLCTH